MTLRLTLLLLTPFMAMTPQPAGADKNSAMIGQTLERLRTQGVAGWQVMDASCNPAFLTTRSGKPTKRENRQYSVQSAFQAASRARRSFFVKFSFPVNRFRFTAGTIDMSSPWFAAAAHRGKSPGKVRHEMAIRPSRFGLRVSRRNASSALEYFGDPVGETRQRCAALRSSVCAREDNGDLQIDFHVAPDAQPDALQRLSGGSISLDPEHHWAVNRYNARYANQMSSSLSLVYGPAGPPELSHVNFELMIAAETKSTFSIDVGKYEWTAVQNAEFTLLSLRASRLSRSIHGQAMADTHQRGHHPDSDWFDYLATSPRTCDSLKKVVPTASFVTRSLR